MLKPKAMHTARYPLGYTLYADRRPGYKRLEFCQEFPNLAEQSELGKVFVW